MTKELAQAVATLRAAAPRAPQVALVLGSGLGHFVNRLQDAVQVPYDRVAGMPGTAVKGHAGNFVLGLLQGVPLVAMQGRAHLYEGHAPQTVVHGVRVMLKLGAPTLLVTNAAGGIHPRLKRGQLMLIRDQLNLTGTSCLLGPNDESLGARFPDMTDAYDPALRELAVGVAKTVGVELAQGVYAGMLGPAYETPAEVHMLASLGADAVGMSTVLEVIAARHMGARCLGISCITNAAAGLSPETLDHADVQTAAAEAATDFANLLGGIIEELTHD